ncbi:uncharacterized protein B0H18DRAFT_1215930 [Fomitopsis serialis]|uniref:uncharacterized protein n=1 Tax=Fomitopsis serialis TaxID=139415 RepID=UPI0020086C3E|nr:uncharacterized protein B0H18DRAFT_1215930 [Neoantrodia serialis]KAH9914544.1 hypothetical protein B0H18DRAFT_1215930 [Neoantrodia serialis]
MSLSTRSQKKAAVAVAKSQTIVKKVPKKPSLRMEGGTDSDDVVITPPSQKHSSLPAGRTAAKIRAGVVKGGKSAKNVPLSDDEDEEGATHITVSDTEVEHEGEISQGVSDEEYEVVRYKKPVAKKQATATQDLESAGESSDSSNPLATRLKKMQSSPDWDTELAGSTPQSPVKRRNISSPPESPMTPSPNKSQIKAKRNEHPSPEDDSASASPTKKSRQAVFNQSQPRNKGKGKQLPMSDDGENPFIEKQGKGNVQIGGKKLKPVLENSTPRKASSSRKTVKNAEQSSIEDAIYAEPPYELTPPQGNKHCLQLDKAEIDPWLKDSYKNMWPLKKYDVPPHACVKPSDLVGSFVEAGVQLQLVNLKATFTTSFRCMWLVNPARASPKNFGSISPGYSRPVVTFNEHPIINVTFGTVEYSHLVTPMDFNTKDGRRRLKSITITPLDPDFDLAWSFWCEVLGASSLALSSHNANGSFTSFSTISDKVTGAGDALISHGKVSLMKKFLKSPSKPTASPSRPSHSQGVQNALAGTRPTALNEILGDRVALNPKQEIPIWDAREYFQPGAANGSFDIEALEDCPRAFEEPGKDSIVAVLHTTSTYPGSSGAPTNLSLNVVGAVILVGND